MAIKHFRPITAGQRKKSTLVNEELTKTAPEKSLLKVVKKNSGRNNTGNITVRHKGGAEKRKYRLIDFRRNKFDIEGTVATIEYDPNRSANIALINYSDGERQMKSFSNWFECINSKNKIVVPGNHDKYLEKNKSKFKQFFPIIF